jgi:cob(I)alamin adenosyltransferase
MRRIYTRAGDSGLTGDASGRKLPKDHPRVVRLGRIDSLQAALDLARLKARGRARAMLQEVQEKLWEEAGPEDVRRLESLIASLGAPPRSFVRFGSARAIALNECRVRCRELESACTPLLRSGKMKPAAYAWLNRLSSLLFMLAVRAGRLSAG